MAFEHAFLLWRVNQLQFRVRAFLRGGRKAAARKLHKEIVACARSLIRFDENHQYENIIFFQRGALRGMLANCLNGYSAEMDVHRVDLTGLLENAVNLQNQEGVARALKDRMRWQAQTGLTVNRSK